MIHVDDNDFGFDSLIIDNSVFNNIEIEGSGGYAIFLERKGSNTDLLGAKYISLTNSTFSNASYITIQVEGHLKNNQTYTTYNIDKVTFANSLKFRRFFRHLYMRDMSGDVSNSIFAYTRDSAIRSRGISSVLDIDYCDVFDWGIDWYRLGDDSPVNAGAGMLFVDPMFADAANGDYTLDASSPLLRAGSDGGAIGDPRWVPIIDGVGEESNLSIPSKYSLLQNYPNPFNPVTKIKFDLPENVMVKLNIYNILGQKVLELVNRELNSGKYNYSFDAGNLPSGVYIYKLETKNYNQTRKMILMK